MGNDHWVASDPDVNQVWVFKANEMIAEINPSKNVTNYGIRAFVSADAMGYPVIAVAYQKANSSKYSIDLFKPGEFPLGSRYLHLWAEDVMNVTLKQLETFKMVDGGSMMYINEQGATQIMPFCAANEYFVNGYC